MIQLLFWICLCFVPIALAFGVACAAAQRAVAVRSGEAYLYAVLALYALFSGLGLLPWAVHQAPLDLAALAFAAATVPLWWAIEALAGPHRHRHAGPVDARRRHTAAPEIAFQHRPPPLRPLVLSQARRVAPVAPMIRMPPPAPAWATPAMPLH